jgi:hypothetical protein
MSSLGAFLLGCVCGALALVVAGEDRYLVSDHALYRSCVDSALRQKSQGCISDIARECNLMLFVWFVLTE